MDYHIRQPYGRRPSISFACPGCRAPLVAGLYDAGSDDQCPHCMQRFTVPGKEEAARVREERVTRAQKGKSGGATSVGSGVAGASGETASSSRAGVSGDSSYDRMLGLGAYRSVTPSLFARLVEFGTDLLRMTFLFPSLVTALPDSPPGRIAELRTRTAYPSLRRMVTVLSKFIGAAALVGCLVIVVSSVYDLITMHRSPLRAVVPYVVAIMFVMALFLYAFAVIMVRIVYHGLNMVIDIPDLLLDKRDG